MRRIQSVSTVKVPMEGEGLYTVCLLDANVGGGGSANL